MTPEHILAYYDAAKLWSAQDQATFSDSVAEAYQVALQVRRLRSQRGELPRGYKIGFTNRGIWPRYNVFAPVWGTVWNTTLQQCEGSATVSLQGQVQPRLEPEVVFGLRATPPPDASVDALFDCLEWVAPGFEVVQSHAPDWKFLAAMTVADGGLHSSLLIGKKMPVRDVAESVTKFNEVLAQCQVELALNGEIKELGCGRNVLDGPMLALHYFLNELHQCPNAPDLLPGDVVTTGTWTDAWPVNAGETWAAEFDAPLSALTVKFS